MCAAGAAGRLEAMGERRVAPAVLAAALGASVLLAGCGRLADHGAVLHDQVRGVSAQSRHRTYRVHVPPGGAAGRPVLLAFHGRLGTGPGMERLTHLDQVADRYRFTVVYPDGVGRSWNDGRPGTPAARAGVDDVAFVSSLIDQLVRRQHVDARRVFATGMSNGAMFTERLGCELGSRLAGIAPVAGPMPATRAACTPGGRVPVLMIHGTADPIVPYGGGPVGAGYGGGGVLSVAATEALWRRNDGCSGRAAVRELKDLAPRDGTRVSLAGSPGCPVQVYTVVGGGHTWPGGQRYAPKRLVGTTSRDFDAAQVICAYFAAIGRG